MPKGIEDIGPMERRKRSTGISGLDFQLGGGFPAGESVVIRGSPLVGIDKMAEQFWKAEENAGTYLMIDAVATEGMVAMRETTPAAIAAAMTSDRVVVDSLSTVIREHGIEAAVSLMTGGIREILEREGIVLFILYDGIHTRMEELAVIRAAGTILTLYEEYHGNEIERKLAVNKLPFADVPNRVFPYNIREEGLDLSTTARVV